MILIAVIKEIEDKQYALIPSSGGCAGKSFFKAKDSLFRFKNPTNLKIENGNVVEIEISPAKSILTSFVFFIVPLIFIAIGYFIAVSFSENSLIIIGASLVGFFFSLLTASFYSKITKRRTSPKVNKVITNFTPEQCGTCSGCGTN